MAAKISLHLAIFIFKESGLFNPNISALTALHSLLLCGLALKYWRIFHDSNFRLRPLVAARDADNIAGLLFNLTT